MKIEKYEMLHGAALAQLTKHPAFTSLNRASPRYGHYLVNESTRLWTKYCTTAGPRWQFTFSPDDVKRIWDDAANHTDVDVEVVLVCGNETICLVPLEICGPSSTPRKPMRARPWSSPPMPEGRCG